MKNSTFFNQAALMVQVLPYVARESCFALKGGTAINLFVRDVPRLSVDIDLVYVTVGPRADALTDIQSALMRIAESIRKGIPGAKVVISGNKNQSPKVFVQKDKLLVKIEPNTTIRGVIYPTLKMRLGKTAEDLFQMSASITVASMADLYGGKLCATLDRQHPRDLFDVMLLLENEGMTKEIRTAFVVYLASHDRPMHELLDPKLKDIKKVFETEFSGMTTKPVSLSVLCDVQKRLGKIVCSSLNEQEKEFLLSFKKGDPKWELLGVQELSSFPALQWKLLNIQKMEKRKHQDQIKKLEAVFQ
jgi:predicted nucleotidyltransferase component of viral defense system